MDELLLFIVFDLVKKYMFVYLYSFLNLAPMYLSGLVIFVFLWTSKWRLLEASKVREICTLLETS